MMDGWMPESISFKCSLRSVALSHFFSPHFVLFRCHFAACTIMPLILFVFYFSVCLIVHYYRFNVAGGKTPIAIPVWKKMIVTFTNFDFVTSAT